MSDALKIARGFQLPLDVVTEATAIVATRGAGKSSASAVIVEEAFALGVQVVVFDRTGVYWGLRSNAAGDAPGLGVYVLGGPHGDVPLEPHAGVLIADLVVDSGHSFVLDLSDFSKSAAVRFAADFVERLYDRKARARTTTLLVIDEAHFYAPQTPRGGFKGDSARLMGAMEDAVGLGRSRGLGVVLTTQRTQALNKAILDLIETLLVMRMLSPRARDAVQDWIREKHEDDREGVIGTLESLPTGTAWVWSPLRGILAKVAVRRIRTFDSYATPRPGETRVEPTARCELDLDALGEQMRATVERARADDPAELRKQIAELRRQLAERPEVEPEQVEVPVEVPVVPIELDAAVGRAQLAIADAVTAIAEAEREREAARPVDRPPSRVARHSPAPATADVRPPVRQDSGARAPAAQNGSSRSSAEARQKVLDGLAWLEAAGISPATRLQTAMVAGYHPRTGTFAQAVADMQREGLIASPSTGMLELLAPGREAANLPGVPTSDRELQQMIMRQVPGLRTEILGVLLDRREPMSRAEVAEFLGYHPRTGTFAGAVGSLKKLGLVEFPQTGWLAPSGAMFLGGGR